MVRLVFRPYTQIRRTICTSVSLRASTRVSPGFTLFRHRSPSFGSQQICSYSNLSQVTIGRQCLPCGIPTSDKYMSFTFITHQGFPPKYSHICQTPWSVFQDGQMKTISSASRRRSDAPPQSHTLSTAKHCFPTLRAYEATGGHSVKRSADTSSIQSMVQLHVYNRSEDPTFHTTFSHASK